MESDEPMNACWTTDSELQSNLPVAALTTDIEDPNRVKLLTDKVEPSAIQSKTEMRLPARM
jgi:hypothetical protein